LGDDGRRHHHRLQEVAIVRYRAPMLAVVGLLVAAGCGGDTEVPLPEGSAVLATVEADLDDDGRPERVRLVGQAPGEGGFRTDLGLVVDGTASRSWPLPSAASSGYDPELAVADVTGDGRPELVMTAATGGSGGLIAAAVITTSLRDDGSWQHASILDAESRAIPRFSGTLGQGFTAALTVVAPGLGSLTETLDLAYRRDRYVETGVYDADGTLIRPVEIWGDGLMGLETVTASMGGPGVRLVQQARGASNADRLAEIRTLLVWRDGGWIAQDLAIRPFR
jgi:hypothetical protein